MLCRSALFPRVQLFRLCAIWSRLTFLTAVAVVIASPKPLFAGGFSLLEYSATSLGNAYSDSTAGNRTPSTIGYNPAGMSLLQGHHVAAGVNHIFLDFEFKNEGSVSSGIGAPLTGGNGGDGGEDKTIPYLHYVYGMGNMAFGIGVFVPFGLATEYDEGWVGRYHGIKSSIEVVNINPSFSYRIVPELTLGFGVSYQMLEANLSNAVDMGLVCIAGQMRAGRTSSEAAGACATLGLPPFTDGFAEVSGKSSGYGWNLGLLYELGNTRIGVAYRSGVEHALEGKAKFSGFPAALQQGGTLFVDTDAKTEVSMPATASLGVAHEYSKTCGVSLDILWTQWNVLDELKFEYDNSQPDSIEDFGWKNTMRYALGGYYGATSELALRGGVAYDQTPIKDKESRNVRLPDTDRTWLALGAGYDMGDFDFDFGYAHLFIADAEVERINDANQTVKGSFTGGVDIVSLEARTVF